MVIFAALYLLMGVLTGVWLIRDDWHNWLAALLNGLAAVAFWPVIVAVLLGERFCRAKRARTLKRKHVMGKT